MTAKQKKPFWSKTRVAIFSTILTSLTLIIVAVITGLFSKNKNSKKGEESQIIMSPQLDTGTQKNTNIQLKQDNYNKGNVNNEIVSGDKLTTNNYNNKRESKVIDTVKPIEIKGKNINTGTNNGIVGDVINYGKIPRIVNDASFENFFKEFPDKNTPLAFYFVGEPDSEMKNVKDMISTLLKKNGYINIYDKISIATGILTNSDISYDIMDDKKSVAIFIAPSRD